MTHLFEPFTLRGLTLRNRIGVAPMCQYSCEDGFATDWHLVHLGSRAVGGAGVVIAEATAVEARGRISPHDLGIWTDAHADALAKTAHFIKEHGAVAGIQLAHAGRKASTYRPWHASHGAVPNEEGGWEVIAPSAIPFSETYRQPHEMTLEDIQQVQKAFVDAAVRALDAGFEWLEIHGAHGYLIHSFYSPISNQRSDDYGGSFENRVRFLREIVRMVRAVMPDHLPLSVRLSCTDWVEGGWSGVDSIDLARLLLADGVELIDCSSGGISPQQKILNGGYPGYQVPFSEMIRQHAYMPAMGGAQYEEEIPEGRWMRTAAVGLITEATHADEIIRNGRADLVYLAREFLRDPYWALHAAQQLKHAASVPSQYLRGF